MKKPIITLIIFLFNFGIFAQNCGPSGITISNQSQVDAFPVNYPGCYNITGSLTISGSDITNLNGLSQLTSVFGGVYIQGNTLLNNLNGLSGISTIGGSLIISNNAALTSLTGLGGLSTVFSININNNPLLTSLTDLSGLTSLGSLSIINNSSLTNCNAQAICNYLGIPSNFADIYGNANGCNSVAQVQVSCSEPVSCPGNITFTSQAEIDAFSSTYPVGCTAITGSVTINGSNITNLNGLAQITSIAGNLSINFNPLLANLSGLNALNSIGGSFQIAYTSLTSLSGLSSLSLLGGDLNIYNNNGLTDLSGLNGLSSIGGSLHIANNTALTNVGGLGNISSIGKDIIISNNTVLTSLSQLSNVTEINGVINISDNAVLTSLTGIDNISYTSITNLIIASSNMLSTCNVLSICDYLSVPSNTSSISGNASGCDTKYEVINTCLNCPLGNITLSTQAQIDAYASNYPGCTIVAGSLTIDDGGTGNINNLNGLIQLTTIAGNLIIQNTTALINFTGLNGITSILGNIFIYNNTGITSLTGLNSLTSHSGDIELFNNGALVSLNGLNNLTSIGGTLIIYIDYGLTDLNGLNALSSIGGSLYIQYNEGLLNLSGLDVLGSIGGGLSIFNNPSLLNFNGLNSLSSIGGELYIYNNAAVTSIAALSNLTSISGALDIENSNALTSLSGLENIDNTSITDLTILSSNSLSTCNVKSICDYLSVPANTYNISGNAGGCNSKAEVILACCSMTASASSYPTTICVGATSQLDAMNVGGLSSFTYSWAPAASLNNATISNPIASPTVTTLYTVTITDANGCTAIATTLVNVYPDLNVSASSNSPLCQAGTISLNADGGSSYVWSGPLGYYSIDQNPFIYNAMPSNSGLYSVTVTDDNGCSKTASTTVFVNLFPTVNPVSNKTYCSFAIVPSIVFTSSTPGATFTWSRTPEAIGLATTDGLGNIPAFTSMNLGTSDLTSTFFVSASYFSNGITCTGPAIQFTITIAPPPVAHCKNAVLYLDAAGQATLTIANINDGSTGGTVSIAKTAFYCSDLGANYIQLTVTDMCNNTSTCNALVTVIDNMPPVLSNVTGSILINCDQTIPAVPIVTVTDNCSATFTYTETNNRSPFLQVCEHYTYTITRTWLATDNSGNTAKKVQIISVEDNIAPYWIFVPPPFITVECNEANLGKIEPIPQDDCDQSPTILKDIKYQFGIFNCVNNYLVINTWTAGDKCGNTIQYVQKIAVVDTTAPEIYCPANIAINSSVAKNVSWLLPTVTDNCGGNPNIVQISGPPSGSLFQPKTVTTITYKATDGCGNSSTCSFTVSIIDQGGGPDKVKISGSIYSKKAVPPMNTNVILSGSLSQSYIANGQFNFVDLPKGANLTVTPNKKDNPLDGVNTLDLVDISNHILGKKPLDSPYKILAADVNKSKNITTADEAQIKKLILHIISKFDSVDSWRFIPAATVFQNPVKPWLNTLDGFIKFTNIQADQTANFTAIKMGDVNESATGAANGNLEVKGINTYSLQAEDKSFKRDEEVELIIGGKELNSLKAMQFTLEYNPDKLEYVGIKSERDDISEEDFGTRYIEDGKITGSIILRDEKGGDKLFSVVLKAKEPGSLLSSISLTSNLTTAEAYTKEDETNSLKLVFTKDGKEESLSTAVLYQNEPNPFENSTVIRFYIPDNQEAILSLYTTAGKVIKETREIYSKGEHQLTVPKEEFPSSGIYYYQLKTNNFIDTKKMMFIK